MEDIYTGHMNVAVAGAVLVRDYEGSHSPVWQRAETEMWTDDPRKRDVGTQGTLGEKRPVDELDWESDGCLKAGARLPGCHGPKAFQGNLFSAK